MRVYTHRPPHLVHKGHISGESTRSAHLVLKDVSRTATAREHLYLIGDSRPGRVDQINHRKTGSIGPFDDPNYFLDSASPHEPAFTVESLAMRHTGRPSIVAVPVITPSAGKPSALTLANAPSSTKEWGSANARCGREQIACHERHSRPDTSPRLHPRCVSAGRRGSGGLLAPAT